MKYLFKIFFLSLILFVNAEGQSVTWQKLYSDEPSFSDGYSAVQLDDEGYIVVGSKVPNNGLNILAMRLDKFGNLIWRRFYEGNNPRTIVKTNEGNFLIGADVLTKINNNGDVIWRRPGSPSFRINLTQDGGFYYCGGVSIGPLKTIPSLKKYDSLGFLTWEKVFDEDFYRGGFSNCLINSDDDLVLIGSFSPGDTIYDLPFIMKTDASGNVIWNQKYNYDSLRYFYLNNIVENVQNNYMVSGSNSKYYLVKFDSSGNWINTNYYGSSTLYPGSFDYMIKTNDNGLALIGFKKFTNNYYFARILKTDYDGNQQWVRLYGVGQVATGNFINQTIDNGFIVAGRRDTFQWAQVYVIKTDESGNTSPYVNVNVISEVIPDNFILYQNYPNPFNPETKINFSIPKSGKVTMKIYDVLGNEVKTLVNEFRNAGSYEVTFDGINLPSGVYYYRMESGNFMQVRKMVLVK